MTGLYYILCAGIVMFTLEPALIALFFPGALLYALSFQGERHAGRHIFRGALFLSLSLINPIFSHNGKTVLFYINDRAFTLEALIYGAVSAGAVITTLLLFSAFSMIMTKDRLLYVLGLFTPKFALVLSMGFRSVPLFLRQYKNVLASQKTTGLYKDGNVVDRIRGGLRVFSIMVTWGLEKGVITADSMAARGYGTGRRTRCATERFLPSDAAALCAEILLFCLVLLFYFLARAGSAFYPELRFTPFSPLYTLCCACAALLSFLPLIIDAKETLKWKYFVLNN